MLMLDFMGGSWQEFTISGVTYNSWGNAYHMDSQYAWNYRRIWRWSPTGATAYVRLPNAATWNIPEGGPTYYMENLHATTYGLRLYTPNGLYLGEIGPQNAPNYNKAIVFCLNNSTNLWTAYWAQDNGLAKMS